MRSLPTTFPALAAFLLSSLAARAQDAVKPPPAEIDALRARIEELERRSAVAPSQGVDLSGDEVASIADPAEANPLGRPWYENVDVWGHASFVYLDTGGVGEHPEGGFIIQEASLYGEARAWDRVLLHAELQAAIVGYDTFTTGELYADLERLWSSDSGNYATLRVGRFWVPFGDETIWFHAPQNPLISYSAAFPWGLDEGVEAYGSIGGLDWTAAVTAGTSERNAEDGSAKTFNLKFAGKPSSFLELDASLMHQGETTSSALLFGGVAMDPVGSNGTSSAGTSPSSEIEANLGELGANLLFAPRFSVGLTLGTAAIDDPVDTFDRDFHWLRCEPRYDITPDLYAVARYSEIGTYDSDEGYHFDGVGIAEGEDLGYDVERFQRIAAGMGWKANPHTILKLEVGRDHFWLIDGSPLSADNEDRIYFALGLVVSF